MKPLLPLVLALSSGLLVGCPGTLERPERFSVDGGGGGSCNGDVRARVAGDGGLFAAKCGTSSACHGLPGAGMTMPAGYLDLISADLESRLVGVASPQTTCSGAIRVIAGNPTGGLLLDKVENRPPMCGMPMPLIPPDPLPAGDLACIRAYVQLIAGGGAMDGGTASDGGGARDAGTEDAGAP